MKLQLTIQDSAGKIHYSLVEVDSSNSSFLKLAAINRMQLVGAKVLSSGEK